MGVIKENGNGNSEDRYFLFFIISYLCACQKWFVCCTTLE